VMTRIRRSGRPSPSAAMFKKHRKKAAAGSDLHKEITQLKSDLAKYGGHTAECASRVWKPRPKRKNSISRYEPANKKCDCGWVEIEKGKGM